MTHTNITIALTSHLQLSKQVGNWIKPFRPHYRDYTCRQTARFRGRERAVGWDNTVTPPPCIYIKLKRTRLEFAGMRFSLENAPAPIDRVLSISPEDLRCKGRCFELNRGTGIKEAGFSIRLIWPYLSWYLPNIFGLSLHRMTPYKCGHVAYSAGAKSGISQRPRFFFRKIHRITK